MPRFSLEGPRRAKSFVCTHTLCMNYVTSTFLLVRSSVRSKELLCFVHGPGQKSELKPTTKNFCGFHNHAPLLTMVSNGCFSESCSSSRKVSREWLATL